MIIDSSALVAILLDEPHSAELRGAIFGTSGVVLPATAITEIQMVVGGRGPDYLACAEALIEFLLANGVEVAPFSRRHAALTATARKRFGKGNGAGGKLNFGDLMVYAVAKDRSEPLLCTGLDFITTDLEIHPASRLS
ncbi:MAG: type II toxin-antitoxin system VapC family toxin [Novosphingobium sp.]